MVFNDYARFTGITRVTFNNADSCPICDKTLRRPAEMAG
jgi:hypothetical protein